MCVKLFKKQTATSKPKKGQMPTMEMFSAKSTTKNDKHIGENPPAEKNGRDYQVCVTVMIPD